MAVNIVDFTELQGEPCGENLERLVRQIGKSLGLLVWSSGRGPDGGRDLVFTETISGSIRQWNRHWIVSCKDNSKSGEAVKESELNDIFSKVRQHHADGFLLVTTTVAGTAVAEKLRLLDIANGGEIFTCIWDKTELTSILIEPEHQEILKQFFPESYKRVLGMTSLEGSLYAFKHEIPDEAFSSVLAIINPFVKHRLRGRDIWPGDDSIGKVLEGIVSDLLVKRDSDVATQKCRQLSSDVLIALLTSLFKQYKQETYDLAYSLVRTSGEADTVVNAYQFLMDCYEFDNNMYGLANYLLTDDLQLLLMNDFEEKIQDYIHINYGKTSIESEINGLAAMAVVNEVIIDSIELQPDPGGVGVFNGTMVVGVEYWFDPGEDTTGYMSFSGLYSGYFDETGINVEQASIDTSPFYEGGSPSNE